MEALMGPVVGLRGRNTSPPHSWGVCVDREQSGDASVSFAHRLVGSSLLRIDRLPGSPPQPDRRRYRTPGGNRGGAEGGSPTRRGGSHTLTPQPPTKPSGWCWPRGSGKPSGHPGDKRRCRASPGRGHSEGNPGPSGTVAFEISPSRTGTFFG